MKNMVCAPDHIRKYCKKTSLSKQVEYENNIYGDNYSFVYQIICDCGCDDFFVYKNMCPYVYTICKQCNKKLVIYDLECYPAASSPSIWLPHELVFKKIMIDDVVNNIIVNYDYNDEYLTTDSRFDMNDITGFNMWLYSDGMYTLIVDDETA